MYIVENIDKNSRFSIPLPSLLQASVNCLVQDGFTVKYTRSHKDSMSHISCITKILIKIYKVCKKHYSYGHEYLLTDFKRNDYFILG